jgi:hypothetical protein
MLEKNRVSEDPFHARLDSEKVGVVGHSSGGTAALLAHFGLTRRDIPADSRIKAIMPISTGFGSPIPFGGSRDIFLSDFDSEVPTFLLSGTLDSRHPNSTGLFSQLGAEPRYLATIENAVHASYADVCDRLDLALANDAPDEVQSLFEFLRDFDGGTCEPPAIANEQALELTRLYAVSFFKTHVAGERDYQQFLTHQYAESNELPVRFEVVPEPTSLTLLVSCGCLVVAFRRRYSTVASKREILVMTLLRNLRHYTFVTFACCCSSPSAVWADNFDILMIGNSYTQGRSAEPLGGTDEDLQGIFDADSTHSATVVTRAEGGWTLQDHANSSDTTNLITRGAITWDFIVLQEQSTLPAQAMSTGMGLPALDNGGPVLIDLIKQQPHLQNASVVLFNTWARELGHSVLDNYHDDPKEMLDFLNQGYNYIRVNSPSWDHSDVTTIAPVGDAWDGWYDTYGYGVSAANLHDDDGSHQSGLGSYLAASVIYETITGDSTVGNTFTGTYQNGVAGMLGGESKLLLLQQQASATTGVANKGDFDQDSDVDGQDLLAWQRGLGVTFDANDLSGWQANYGTVAPLTAISSAVPEPSTSIMLLIGMVTILTGGRTLVPKLNSARREQVKR